MHYNPEAFADAIEIKSADDGHDAGPDGLTIKMLADLTNAVEAKVAAAEKKAADRLDKLETKLNRPAVHTSSDNGDAAIEKKALDAFYRTGSDLELKTLTTLNGTAGIVALAQLSTTILEKIAEQSPVRQLASSVSMTGPMISIPRLVGEVEVQNVAELLPDPRPTSEPSFEQIDLKSNEMSVFVPVSRTMLEDANVDLGSYIQSHLVRRFAQKEARQFVVGNGVIEAEGVLTSEEVNVFGAATSTITADDLIDLVYSIKSAYAANGSFLMNRKTMATIRKLKDSDGSYLWQSSIAAGQPNTILGRPVYEAVDMPNVDKGATPIVFGDFATGYLIGDRIAFEPLRVDVANVPVIQIGGRRRVGGRVVMGEALTKLKLKA